MIPKRVDEPADPRLADYLELTDPARRRDREQSNGFFIAEGRIVLDRLLGTHSRIRSVLVAEERLDSIAALLARLDPRVPVFVVNRDVAETVTGYDVHRGILAAVDRPPDPDLADLLATARLVVVLEDLTDQTNIGSVFRNAATLGAEAVLLSPGCGDPLYRRSVRVSMGASFEIPFCRLAPWPQGLTRLVEAGFAVIGLTPDRTAAPLDEFTPPTGSRTALVLGSEGPGLSDPALAACSDQVCVEMASGADSLNVATAAAIALYVVARRMTPAPRGISRSSVGP